MDATTAIDGTQMGMLKAMHFLATQHQRQKIKQKFFYESAGSTTRATRCLIKAERAEVTAIVEKLVILDPVKQQDEVQQVMKDLAGKPIKFVPVKREIRIDYSKTYPYRSKKRGG
jgi:hypothetical protein